MVRLRPLLLPAIFTICMGAFLAGLGIWQLHRLAWKEGIIATIATRTRAPPRPMPPPSTWPGLKPVGYAYRHVTLEGRFENDKEALVFRGGEDGPGYLVMTPLALRDGGYVIVNRGWVPDELKDRVKREAGEPTGPVTVTGLMREPESRNLFTPADQPADNQFFTRDPVAIAASLRLAHAAPFTIDADATANPGGWPRGGTTAIDIPNNHFSYALTWFGLALGLFGVFFSFAWKRLVEPPDETSQSPPTDTDPLRAAGR